MKFLIYSNNFKSKKETLKFVEFFSIFIKRVFKFFPKGLFIFFSGPFGAGKTTLIQFIAKNLKIKENLRSPSFIILKTYETKINSTNVKFHHLDLYRIKEKKEIFTFLKKNFKKNNIFCIEWGENFLSLVKYSFIFKIEFLNLKEGRKIKVYLKT